MNVEALKAHMAKTGGVAGFEGAQFVEDGARVLVKECDILIPAALERVLHDANPPAIQAKLVVEAANGPTTFEGDQILRERGIVVLPDLYVNAGGVVVSYFEWVKNLTHIPFGSMAIRFDGHSVRWKDVTTNRVINSWRVHWKR
ncbi:MAG: hypothetical protein KJ622_02280 [Alphaproteobacteria bacterium]|nr:hypothetical protein [Alphaproteobacteria bacterium]